MHIHLHVCTLYILDIANLWTGVYEVSDSIIGLCQRNSGKLDEIQREVTSYGVLPLHETDIAKK